MLEPATPETYNFRFSAGKEFRQKLERLAEVLGVADPVRQMGEILEKAVDSLLERKDPRQRRARRLRREERRRSHLAPDVKPSGSAPEAAPEATSPEVPAPAAKQGFPSGHPPPFRRRLGRRPRARRPPVRVCRPGTAGGAARRAPGVGKAVHGEGRASARSLPGPYPVPWSISRSSEPERTRVHCPAHDSLTAREYSGEEHIDRKVAEARESRRAGRERGKDLGGGTGGR